MSGVVAIIDWDDPQGNKELVEGLLDRVPHRATDGRACLTVSHCAMGFARHATTARERRAPQPLRDDRRGMCVVADLRLDNRRELCDALGVPPGEDPHDPELLLLGYERWGTGLAGRLAGDFAFVIWDTRRRELYAARDPFGIRPLYYHASARRLVLASEVEQLLALDGVSREVDERTVCDFLLDTYGDRRRTFFREVTRIVPGHYLLARDGLLREGRYWEPPREVLRLKRREEYAEEFARRFRQAVRDRLEADGPIVAQLSGGLDSSSIVCVAGEIYRREGAGRPPLRLASAVYPGLNCDETPYIDAVARTVPFPSERYDGTAWDPEDEERFHVMHPWREAAPGYSWGWRRIALREGARVALCGFGGDELLWERGVFQDLAARGRWLALFRETALISGRLTPGQIYSLKDALLGALPSPLSGLVRYVRRRRPAPPPAWLTPQLGKLLRKISADRTHERSWTSHTQRWTYKWLTSPAICWGTDISGYGAARRGVEMRFPFLDARLARFVLAMPFEHRLPSGVRRRFLRRSLADVLPREIAERRQVTTFEANVDLFIRRHLHRHEYLLRDGIWESEPYVERREVERLLSGLTPGAHGTTDWRQRFTVWNILILERWLRDLANVRWKTDFGREPRLCRPDVRLAPDAPCRS